MAWQQFRTDPPAQPRKSIADRLSYHIASNNPLWWHLSYFGLVPCVPLRGKLTGLTTSDNIVCTFGTDSAPVLAECESASLYCAL